MTGNSDKILERVRALIAQADSTPYEEEANTFRDKAQQLMEQYAIAEWQLRKTGAQDVAHVERRYIDIHWYWQHDQGDSLWSMMCATASLAGVMIVGHDVKGRSVAMLGLPADLDYTDLLFTSLMFQMNRSLGTEYDASAQPIENIYTMRSAGRDWPQIAEKLYSLKVPGYGLPKGHTSDRWGRDVTDETRFMDLPLKTQQSIRAKCASQFRQYCKDTGLPQNKENPRVYARSYAEGFSDRVVTRIYRRQHEQKQRVDNDTNSLALALRDTGEMIKEYYRELYAEYLLRKAEAEANAKGRKRRASSAVDKRRYSYAGREAGEAAGDRADISTNAGQVGSRKFLGS